MYTCSSLFKILDFYSPISANYWCVFHYFSCVFPVWRLPGNMFCPSTITFHPRRPVWSVGMKLLAVIMELSLVEAAKSSLKELLKVKGLAHPLLLFFFLYFLERGTNFPGPSILIILGMRSLAGPSQSFSEPKEASFSYLACWLRQCWKYRQCRQWRWSQLVLGTWWALEMKEKLMIWKDLIFSLLVFHSAASGGKFVLIGEFRSRDTPTESLACTLLWIQDFSLVKSPWPQPQKRSVLTVKQTISLCTCSLLLLPSWCPFALIVPR